MRLSLVESEKYLQLLTSLEEPVLVMTTTALFSLFIRQLHHQQWQDREEALVQARQL